MAGFYYRQLNKEQRMAYDAMYAGFQALAPAIRVPRLDNAALSDVYQRLKLDEPRIFFVVGFAYRYDPRGEHVELIPEYLFDKGKIKMHRQAVDKRVERLAAPLKGKSDREKEEAIHAFILENVHYD